MQPISSLFHIPTGFTHNSGHAGGLRSFSTDRETVYRNCLPLCTMGRKTWRHGEPHAQNCDFCGDDLARINMIDHFYAPGLVRYSSLDKMANYDWNTFRNYVAFLAGGTRRPHHDSELISCYHEAFLTWGHNHNDIVLFYHDSPITRSHFMDPTDRAIKGFYCIVSTPKMNTIY